MRKRLVLQCSLVGTDRRAVRFGALGGHALPFRRVGSHHFLCGRKPSIASLNVCLIMWPSGGARLIIASVNFFATSRVICGGNVATSASVTASSTTGRGALSACSHVAAAYYLR